MLVGTLLTTLRKSVSRSVWRPLFHQATATTAHAYAAASRPALPVMKHATLRTLLEDPRPPVAGQAQVVAAGLARSGPLTDLLDLSIDQLVGSMTRTRRALPDKSTDLSIVDSTLIPLLELHRAIYVAQPVEDQLEPSEADLLAFGITAADLKLAAKELGCTHLGPAEGPQPEQGQIVSIKRRILVVRNINIRGKALSVTFLLHTGAPVSFVCAETLRAFGVDMDAQPGNFVRGEVGGEVLDLYFLDPSGDKHDLNILGMDYLMGVNASLKFDFHTKTVLLTTT